MYTKLLVPLDGSSFSEHALPLALDTARRSSAKLHLAHVHVADTNRKSDSTIDAQQRERERAYLAATANRLSATWSGPIETALLDGSAAEAIMAYAEEHGIDLVVLTTHGRGALSRAWLGSVADRLIRRLPMPMLLIRPHETDPVTIANPPSIKHILIPLDGSPMSECILPHATELGQLTGATYTLLQTIEIFIPSYGFGTYTPSDLDIDAWVKETQQYLDRVATKLRAAELQVETDVIIGPPVMTILEYARDHAVDLIATETHVRSGAARLFLGSVADKIVRGADVPVLLHRPPSETPAP